MLNNNPAKTLDGFQILDFTQNVARPFAGQTLA